MAENSKIQWTDHTFNPWEGCAKVSEGCANCYAEARANRFGTVKWGPQGTRRIASESYWKQPLKWNREAQQAGVRRRVFCASLADWLEDRTELIEPRGRLLTLIQDTPNLDWLLLTKRPEGWEDRLHEVVQNTHDGGDVLASHWLDGDAPFNVWLGVSVENQEAAYKRIDLLKGIPANIRFLSCEPLLSALYLPRFLQYGIHWAIVGGESGRKSRPFFLGWARDLLGQCRAAGVSFFMKQAGSDPHDSHVCEDAAGCHPLKLIDPKGGDLMELPEDLRVREFPTVEAVS